MPNPYTLLSLLPPGHCVYTVLDLKNAFFSLPLSTVSQPIFTFKWTDPEEGYSRQLTWTKLLQDFKNSATLFDETLSQDLTHFRQKHPGVTLLRYIDDLLATEDYATCRRATKDLLLKLAQLGYGVSAKKAQLCTQTTTYLGYEQTNKKNSLPVELKLF